MSAKMVWVENQLFWNIHAASHIWDKQYLTVLRRVQEEETHQAPRLWALLGLRFVWCAGRQGASWEGSEEISVSQLPRPADPGTLSSGSLMLTRTSMLLCGCRLQKSLIQEMLSAGTVETVKLSMLFFFNLAWNEKSPQKSFFFKFQKKEWVCYFKLWLFSK